MLEDWLFLMTMEADMVFLQFHPPMQSTVSMLSFLAYCLKDGGTRITFHMFVHLSCVRCGISVIHMDLTMKLMQQICCYGQVNYSTSVRNSVRNSV